MRPFALAFAAALALAACAPQEDTATVAEDGSEVEITDEPADVGTPDLLGSWVLAEQNADFPEQLYLVTFDSLGAYTVSDAGGTVLRRETYQFSGEDGVSITDSTGAARLYQYELGATGLVLRDTSSGATARFEPREDYVGDDDVL